MLFFKSHHSLWFSNKKNYLFLLKEDVFIRNFIINQLSEVFVSLIEIKRKSSFLIVDIHVAKPGIIIGNNGVKLLELQNNLAFNLAKNFSQRNVTINVLEVVSPDLNSRFLSDFIRQQLEKRVPFRRVIKSAIVKAQKAGAKGIKIQISGRLNGAEIARTEWVRDGQVPLHTLKANIDYYNHKARLVVLIYIKNFL